MSLIDGLVHLWSLDEDSGSSIIDIKGNLGYGNVVNDVDGDTIIAAPAGFGNARDLEAASPDNAYLELYTGPLDGGDYSLSQWTFSIRTYQTAISPDELAYLCMHHWTQQNNSFQIFIDYWNSITTAVYASAYDDAGNYVGVGSDDSIYSTIGAWRKVTVTNDGTYLRMYHDDYLVDTSNALISPVKLHLKNTATEVGTWLSSTGTRSPLPYGAVDEIAIWSRALSSDEISSSEFLSEPIKAVDPWPDDISQLVRFSVLDVDDGVLPPLRVPISSWQSTLQSGDRSSFAQAVIPAATPWISGLSDRKENGEIIISHGLKYPDGSERLWEIVRVPFQQLRIQQGANRVTATIIGYAITADSASSLSYDFEEVQTLSIDTGTRVRVILNPNVRPNNTITCSKLGIELVASYINMYSTSSNEAYMDVGERAL